MAVSPLETVPDDLRMLVPGLDSIHEGVPGMHTEADVAYGALSTFTMAVHEIAQACEQGRTYLGHHVGAVAIGWNEQARTTGQLTGLSGVDPTSGALIHAETVVGAKARDYGMRILYLGVLAPAPSDGEDTGSPYPCVDCRATFQADDNPEFTPHTLLLSGADNQTLMVGTLGQLYDLYNPLQRAAALRAVEMPPVQHRTYQNHLLRELGAAWAQTYPTHRAARSLALWRR